METRPTKSSEELKQRWREREWRRRGIANKRRLLLYVRKLEQYLHASQNPDRDTRIMAMLAMIKKYYRAHYEEVMHTVFALMTRYMETDVIAAVMEDLLEKIDAGIKISPLRVRGVAKREVGHPMGADIEMMSAATAVKKGCKPGRRGRRCRRAGRRAGMGWRGGRRGRLTWGRGGGKGKRRLWAYVSILRKLLYQGPSQARNNRIFATLTAVKENFPAYYEMVRRYAVLMFYQNRNTVTLGRAYEALRMVLNMKMGGARVGKRFPEPGALISVDTGAKSKQHKERLAQFGIDRGDRDALERLRGYEEANIKVRGRLWGLLANIGELYGSGKESLPGDAGIRVNMDAFWGDVTKRRNAVREISKHPGRAGAWLLTWPGMIPEGADRIEFSIPYERILLHNYEKYRYQNVGYLMDMDNPGGGAGTRIQGLTESQNTYIQLYRYVESIIDREESRGLDDKKLGILQYIQNYIGESYKVLSSVVDTMVTLDMGIFNLLRPTGILGDTDYSGLGWLMPIGVEEGVEEGGEEEGWEGEEGGGWEGGEEEGEEKRKRGEVGEEAFKEEGEEEGEEERGRKVEIEPEALALFGGRPSPTAKTRAEEKPQRRKPASAIRPRTEAEDEAFKEHYTARVQEMSRRRKPASAIRPRTAAEDEALKEYFTARVKRGRGLRGQRYGGGGGHTGATKIGTTVYPRRKAGVPLGRGLIRTVGKGTKDPEKLAGYLEGYSEELGSRDPETEGGEEIQEFTEMFMGPGFEKILVTPGDD